MKKIIHLSDLHIGYDELGEKFNCIVDDIIYIKKPAEDYVVVITGDIVENANAAGSYEEAKMYFDKLERAGFDVLVVPGNHDYGTGWLGQKKYVKRFKEKFFGDPGIRYPKLDIIDDVAFIGLDSMEEELHWYDALFAQGELGDAQLDRLRSILEDPAVQACAKRVVYLHHHPFDRTPGRQLKDSEELEKVLRAGKIDVLLYGHRHGGLIRNGQWGIRRCYDGGTTTSKDGENNPHRVMDLSRDPRHDYDAEFGKDCWRP